MEKTLIHPFHSINCNGRVDKIKFSQDGSLFATLVSRCTIRVFGFDQYERISSISLDEFIWDFSISIDKKRIAIISCPGKPPNLVNQSATVRVYNLETGVEQTCQAIGNIWAIAFCDSNAPIVIGKLPSSRPNTIEIYDEHLINRLDGLEISDPDFAIELVYCSKANLLGTVGIGATLWDLSTKTLLWDLIAMEKEGGLKQEGIDIWESTAIDISQDGEYVVVGHWGTDRGKTEKVCIYSIKSQEIIGWRCRGFEMITSVVLSPHARYIAATGDNEPNQKQRNPIARIWDFETGKVLEECKLPGMMTVAFSPDGRFLFTGAEAPNSVVIWELSIE